MKKIVFKNIDEVIYKETLSNGINVYLYPTNKSKNFLATITVNFGGKIKEYKINDKSYEIIPGSAHFLEHKIMNLSKIADAEKKINELGVYANAYTSYDVTNYNIYGSKNIADALELLLDLFYNPDVTKENVESEKGIILEELSMYKNTPGFRINEKITNNVFENSFINTVLVGEEKDINNINEKELKIIYKNFYNNNKSFITIVGNFEKENIIEFLENYMKKIKLNQVNKIKYKKVKEQENVVIPYMEINENISIPRVKCGIKIFKKLLPIKDTIKRRYYLNFIFSSLFSTTSDYYDKYKTNELMISASYTITDVDDYYFVNVGFLSENPTKLIEKIKKDANNLTIDESTFNRKKKMFINNLILGFENIEDVENMIVNNINRVGKVINNSCEILEKMNYKELIKILKSIDFNNSSILKIMPKEN